MDNKNSNSGHIRVNIGAGKTYIQGFVNVDIAPVADVVVDLNKDVLPFEDNSVDIVFSYHALEHVENYLFALGEIHRVLKHGGWFLLGVPYVTLTEFNLVNPYHKQNFNEYSFDFFDVDKLSGSAAEESQIIFSKVFHRFHYMGAFNLLPGFLKNTSRRHLFNVVRKIDFGMLAVKDVNAPLPTMKDLDKTMREEFLRCCMGRTPYGRDPGGVTAGVSKGRGIRRRIRNVKQWWSGGGY